MLSLGIRRISADGPRMKYQSISTNLASFTVRKNIATSNLVHGDPKSRDY